MSTTTYILITPVRNEAQHIERTLRSMVAQTLKPLKWIIVSDGSTDGTDDIICRYCSLHPWIELLRMPDRAERHFAGKVRAFNAGYSRAIALEFDIVGNLDGDVSFGPNHFEHLILKMSEMPGLGVAGAPFLEGGCQYDFRFANIENVWGGCQLFRRKCFEEIGGYLPLKTGCIDHIAVLSARMHGWQTRTFTESVCLHHRQMGTALNGAIKARFNMGVKDYFVGNHPLWELSRTFYQMSKPPAVIGGMALGWGYLWSLLKGKEHAVSEDLMTFVRREQMQRLRRFLFRENSRLAAQAWVNTASRLK